MSQIVAPMADSPTTDGSMMIGMMSSRAHMRSMPVMNVWYVTQPQCFSSFKGEGKKRHMEKSTSNSTDLKPNSSGMGTIRSIHEKRPISCL
jgi:hypothetical protein